MPRGPRKLAVSFNTKALTHYGGVYLLHPFLTRIGFKNAVASEIRLAQRNNRYTVGELVLAVLHPMGFRATQPDLIIRTTAARVLEAASSSPRLPPLIQGAAFLA